jgi:uncharacterized membrane protein
MAAFVLMKQNRMGVIAYRRDHVDLQVNLLTERWATKIIRMVGNLSSLSDADSRELEEHAAVEHVVEEMQNRLTRD